jgi:RNA polymerase sigma-70 factor (ECF subfamily)
MLLQESRRAARCTLEGEMILIDDQDRSLWNRDQITEGIALTENALRSRRFGAYTLQAAIAAVHAESASPATTDWHQIVLLYDRLLAIQPSPVVELNRAVAASMAFGPAAGLELVDELVNEPALESYHLLRSVRGDLLAKLGRGDEARREFERAAALAQNSRERELLLARAKTCEARELS